MSARTPPRLETSIRQARPGRPEPRARRPRGLLIYLVVRLTGVALAVLVLGHFALTHVVTDVAETDSGFVAERWASALWVGWDWTMLGAALARGGAGVWIIVDDHTPDARRRRLRRLALVVGCGALWVLGSVLIAVAILG
jgi:succinate dehydrogenase hydrophobic anchor subunit